MTSYQGIYPPVWASIEGFNISVAFLYGIPGDTSQALCVLFPFRLVNSLPLILTWTKTATDTALPLWANLLSTAYPAVALTDLTFLSTLHPRIS